MTIAVLLDLDGTLVDSAAVAVASFRDAFKACSAIGEPPVSRFLALAGRPFEDIVERLGLPARMTEAFKTASLARAHEVATVPGMWAILEDAREFGCSVGVITGKDRVRAEHLLTMLNLADFVDALVTPSDPPPAKPAPDGVHWLCQQFNADLEDTVLVGDSVADIAAGRAAGVRTIGCLWGVGKQSELVDSSPDRLVASPDELRSEIRRFVRIRTGANRMSGDTKSGKVP